MGRRRHPHETVGSPIRAGLASLASFAVGATVPRLPFLLVAGAAAAWTSALLAALALYGLGASIGMLTARAAWRSGGRELVLGLVAAAITFLIGHMLGVVTA